MQMNGYHIDVPLYLYYLLLLDIQQYQFVLLAIIQRNNNNIHIHWLKRKAQQIVINYSNILNIFDIILYSFFYPFFITKTQIFVQFTLCC